MENKSCIVCFEIKELNLFVKKTNSCKVCKSIDSKKYYQENKEYFKKNYQENKEILKNRSKQYHKNSKEKVLYMFINKSTRDILYIGSTTNPTYRYTKHKQQYNTPSLQQFFHKYLKINNICFVNDLEFHYESLNGYTNQEMIEIEKNAIINIKPICNIQHNIREYQLERLN